MLNIKPLHDSARSCVEDNIVSFASWIKRNYEMMYLNSWNFIYDRSKGQLLGERLDEGEDYSLENLYKYHGIKVVKYKMDSDIDLKRIISSELIQSRPVLLLGDSFYYPWHKNYQLEHIKSSCLVIDINLQTKRMICLDPYNILTICQLYIDKNIIFEYSTFRIENNNDNTNLPLVLMKALDDRNNQNPYMFVQMEDFANDIGNMMDLSKEVISETDEIECELLNRIQYITRRRKQYRQLLLYIENRCSLKFDESLIILDNIIYRWTRFHKELMRTYCLKNWTELRTKFSTDMIAIAQTEESLNLNLIRYLKSK